MNIRNGLFYIVGAKIEKFPQLPPEYSFWRDGILLNLFFDVEPRFAQECRDVSGCQCLLSQFFCRQVARQTVQETTQ